MNIVARAALGGVAGAVATCAMDFAGTIILEKWTSADAKTRERDVEPKFPLTVLGERISQKLGLHPIEKSGEALSTAMHWGIGIACGALHGAIERRARMEQTLLGQPIAMGMLAVDEFGFPAVGLCPPPSAFPRETHVRAVLSHVTYGFTLALVYAALRGIADPAMLA